MIRIVIHSPPLTVADVAQRLGVSKQRILDYLHEGRVDGAWKLGGTWYFAPHFRVRPGTRDGGPIKRRGNTLAECQQTGGNNEAERASPVQLPELPARSGERCGATDAQASEPQDSPPQQASVGGDDALG